MWFSLFHQSVFPGQKNHIFWSSSLVSLTWVQEGCRRPEDTLVASSQLWGHLDQATRTDTKIKAGAHRWNTNSEPKSEEGSKQVFIPDEKDIPDVTGKCDKQGTETGYGRSKDYFWMNIINTAHLCMTWHTLLEQGHNLQRAKPFSIYCIYLCNHPLRLT